MQKHPYPPPTGLDGIGKPLPITDHRNPISLIVEGPGDLER